MKKKWIFIISSFAMLFSLGFMPVPVNEAANNPPAKSDAALDVELIVKNNAKYTASFSLDGVQPYFYSYFYVQKGETVTKTINIKPGSYKVYTFFWGSENCRPMSKAIKVTSKTKTIKVSLKCGKSK